jgi:hypothetical protein
MTFALLNIRNQMVKDLEAQGYEITGAGMFINRDRHEADICANAPSGESYHIVIWPSDAQAKDRAEPVEGLSYGPDTR